MMPPKACSQQTCDMQVKAREVKYSAAHGLGTPEANSPRLSPVRGLGVWRLRAGVCRVCGCRDSGVKALSWIEAAPFL